jgi:VanZ family protein
VALALSLAYGGVTELYQIWIPGRIPSMLDFLFDTAGILSSVWLYQLVQFQNPYSVARKLFHA